VPPQLIEVFADVACPFTHVGLHRLVARRRALGREDVRLRVRAWPLELVNGAPLEPATVGHKVAELRAQVAPDLFAGFSEERFPATSLPALALERRAYRLGDDAGEAMALLLRQALFEDGADLASPTTLADLARQLGVPPASAADQDAVLGDWHEGQERGVVGSPHFFVGDTGWFCPSLRIATTDDGLRIDLDDEALERFSLACFDR
jgi:predicted DsbA family dithiol-disulfide isomerase